MRSVWLTTACLGIFVGSLVGVARGDLEKGTIAPDIEAKEWLNTENGESVSLADCRGLIVVLYFWVSFHDGGKYYMSDLNAFESGRARGNGIYFIGLTSGDRRGTEKTIKEEKVFFPVGVESHTDKEYKLERYPTMVVIDPSGRVAWSGSPGDANAAIGAINEVFNHNPPTRTHPQLAKKARKSLDDAKAALRKGNIQEAFKQSRDAFDASLNGDALKTTCQDMLDLVDALGKDKVADAERQIDDGKIDDGVKILRLVIRQYRGLDAAKIAKTKLEALGKTNTKVAEILKTQQGAAKARGDIKKAKDAINEHRFGDAYDLLEGVVKDFGESDEAEEAQGMLERMRKNETVMQAVRDHIAEKDCKSWLATARTFISAKRYDEAKKLLNQILEKYPDTIYAKDAAKELIKLP